MPLDLEVQQMLADLERAGVTPMHQLSPQEARRQMLEGTAALGPSVEIAAVEDQTIDSTATRIPIRIYRPSDDALPIVIYFHGGGWVIGSIETHDGYCRALAKAAQATVVSVEYRLAPEHRYPAALDDAYDATVWAHQQMATGGPSRRPLVVAGDSAGGNLAAAVALRSRDENGPEIDLQALIYPITDYDFTTQSYRDFAADHYLTLDTMRWFWETYSPDEAQRTNPYLSPLRANNLRDLPQALVLTAEFDPLRDEGERYAEKLAAAGVDVKLTRYDGMIHGFTRRLNLFDQAQTALEEVAQAIREL